eukprot:jgi/Chrpa1/16017/Chrysochromulina_OHIO_Genome00024756-RA
MPPRSVPKPARTLALEAAERFAKELHALAVADQNWDEVRESGGIDLLVGLLKMGPCPASTEAAAALTHLAHCVENRDAIRESGGVVLLVKLLAKPHDRPGMEQHDWVATAANAASALRNLTHNNEKNQDAIRDADGVRPLIGLLSHRAPCESSPSGSGPSSAASRAADALGGLARNTHRVNQMAIRDAGGIEQLVALLHEQPIGEAATKAAGALKHLAFAYSANREAIREAGGIEPLVALLELRRDAEEDVMIIAGALWNLGYNNPSNQDAIREAGGVRCARLSPAPLLASPSTLWAPATTLWAPATTRWTPATTLWAPALRRAAAAHHGAAHPFPLLSCVGPPCSPRRRRAHHGAALACCPAAVCALARRLLVQLLQTGAGWKAMPNVVGAIRNLCQNSTANKDAVREAGGIAGLVELLKAGEISSAAVKAAETLEV